MPASSELPPRSSKWEIGLPNHSLLLKARQIVG